MTMIERIYYSGGDNGVKQVIGGDMFGLTAV